MTRLGALRDGRRLVQFASVGLVGAMLDLTVSSALYLYIGIRPEIAKIVGAECAIILMFLLNDRYTFGQAGGSRWIDRLTRLLRSNVVRSGGIAVQVIVVFVLTRLPVSVMVGGTDVWPVVTMPIAIGCGFVVNYAGETLITWRVHRAMESR